MQLENKVAIVTGAGSGIGRAIAIGLHIGARAMPLACDVTDEAQIEAMVDATAREMGRIDILVNNAGVALGGPLAKMSTEDFDTVFATNMRGTFLCSRAVLKHMIPQRSGSIVNTASGLGRKPRMFTGAYAASKAAVIHFTETLAMEVARYGIRVNAFTPGVTDTPLWRRFRSEEDIAEAFRTGQVGTPEDLVPTVVFLCSDASRELSGATIPREIFVSKGDTE